MSIKIKSKYSKLIKIDGSEYNIFDIKKAAEDCGFELNKLPYSLRVIFENIVRNGQGNKQELEVFKTWLKNKTSKDEISYMPARVLMQDFTGVPAIVDLASMRDAMKVIGADPQKINPMIPVDLVIDHSVQVDSFGSNKSLSQNTEKEIERNKERYQFLKWGQKSFSNFRVVPPGTGICHQVNLEYLAQTIYKDKESNLYPDTLVGTDSHTTMVNALAVLGWGVGGIEAEAAMLGQALPMILPEVIGFRMTGNLNDEITATDLVLTVTQILRKKGVVGKFVEFFGPGVDNLSLADRATISNMAPEYGATCGFFPVDAETLKYLRFTGRDKHQLKIVEEYTTIQGMWRDSNEPEYTDVVELDLSTIETSLAGPKRPQDRVKLSEVKTSFEDSFPNPLNETLDKQNNTHQASLGELGNASVVIAAITSCTNTSNPSVMIAAGIVAKKALALGLKTKKWVKTSLAPGSQVVTEYLKMSGLSTELDNLGFNVVGYGCTSCIGNSGPLEVSIDKAIKEKQLAVASVLSGNRNFEGRVHPSVKANYLASPPLVVAYALAGTVNIDLSQDPIATLQGEKNIYLKDIWPTRAEINEYMDRCVTSEMFVEKYQNVFTGDDNWQNIITTESDTYDWNDNSTYIKNPPYFIDIDKPQKPLADIKGARLLALFGDSITTDHISPAGTISLGTPAAEFLIEQGVQANEFNSYGARRGNHDVMIRGTFANIRIKNQLCPAVEGGVTINHFTQEKTSIYDAAMDYRKRSVPLVIFAGKEYGTGSSRDWAAKGTSLLGVKAVIAESFERIHRSNLVGMGVLPISFKDGMKWQDLNLQGDEEINILGINKALKPYQELECSILYRDGNNRTIAVILQIYTDNEVDYIKHGSILGSVIKNLSN